MSDKSYMFKIREGGLLTRSVAIRVNESQKEWLEKNWDRKTFGKFSDFFRFLIDQLKSESVSIEELLVKNNYAEKKEVQ